MKHLKFSIGLLVILAIIIGSSHGVFAKTDLEKAAIKEGSLTWYDGIPIKLAQKIADAFMVHYPEIKVKLFRSGSAKLSAKIAAEIETGRILGDVTNFADKSSFLDFKKKGWLEKYTPEEFHKIDPRFRDPDGYFFTPRLTATAIWYNVEKLKKLGLDPPSSWRDLTDPKYRGKIVLGSPLYSGTYLHLIGYFVNLPGWGWDYWRKVIQNDTLLIGDIPDIGRMVSAGQREIGPCIWGYISMWPPYPKGTIKVTVPEEGALYLETVAAILKGSPHPNAAKLFHKFTMSKEVADMITGDFYYAGRIDATLAPGKPPITQIKSFTTDSAWIKEHKRDIQRMWTKISKGAKKIPKKKK